VTGGRALELHLGRSWRGHDDTDLSFCRTQAAEVRKLLASWDIQVAAAGELTPWDGSTLSADTHQNNLWCRRQPGEPWCLDLTVSDGDDADWSFRRDPTLRVPWAVAVLKTRDGVPYLSPELQLLFKARDPRPKDHEDAAEVIPVLDLDQATLLRRRLPADHPWLALPWR